MARKLPWEQNGKAEKSAPVRSGRQFNQRPYANPSDEEPSAPIQAIMRHLDLTVAAVRKLRELGVMAEGMSLAQSRFRYIHHMRNALERGANEDGEGGEDGVVNSSRERALLAKAQRERVELENAETRGELVRINKIAPELNDAFSNARVRFLGIPSRLAHELAAVSNVKETEAILKAAIVETLDELAERAGRSISNAVNRPGGNNVEAAAEPDPAGVGGRAPRIIKRGKRRAGALAD